MTIFFFILIGFMAIYPTICAIQIERKHKAMHQRQIMCRQQMQSDRYQRYLRTHNAWINRMYHEMHSEIGEKRYELQ
jgi:uncharacterized membrane protein